MSCKNAPDRSSLFLNETYLASVFWFEFVHGERHKIWNYLDAVFEKEKKKWSSTKTIDSVIIELSAIATVAPIVFELAQVSE